MMPNVLQLERYDWSMPAQATLPANQHCSQKLAADPQQQQQPQQHLSSPKLTFLENFIKYSELIIVFVTKNGSKSEKRKKCFPDKHGEPRSSV